MRNRFAPIIVAIASGLTMACGDAAVERVTAPKVTATPATPVANEYPSTEEFENAGIPAAAGIMLSATTHYEDDYRTFVATLNVRFTWSNNVSASLKAWVQNKTGQVINSGSAGMSYRRWLLPVARGDTTFTVRVSTNGIRCGLIGKAEYEGSAAQIAFDLSKMLQIELAGQQYGQTTTPDNAQPDCTPDPGCEQSDERVIDGDGGFLASDEASCDDPAPSPPSGGDGEEVEVCVAVWRELWMFIPPNTFRLLDRWFLGTICYTVTM
jgi:hypothetical protein